MNSIVTPQTEAKKAARQRIAREANLRHAAEWKSAGWLRRLALWVRIQQEISAEMKRLFPPHGLYLTRPV